MAQPRVPDAGDDERKALEPAGMTGRLLVSSRGRHASFPKHGAALQDSSGASYGPLVDLLIHWWSPSLRSTLDQGTRETDITPTESRRHP